MLLALSFPRYGHAAVGLVAVVPLLLAVSGWRGRAGQFYGTSWRRGFALGACAGFVHFAGTIYWTGAVVATFGGLPPFVAILCAMALAAYMTLYIATATALLGAAVRRAGVHALACAPMLWVAGEFARGHVLGGFPWVPLGSSTTDLLPVAQLASVVGVYGVSWFLVSYSTLILLAFTARTKGRVIAGGLAVAVLLAVSAWGSARVADGRLTREGSPLMVGLVQPNVAQSDKWDPRMAGDIGRRYVTLTRDATSKGAALVLWPESSTPYLFNEDPVQAELVRSLARESGVPILFGTDEVERGNPDRYYNSAFMLDRGGATAAVYRKIQLVPFGEYVPLRRLLFFVRPLVEAVSDFTPGDHLTMMPVAGHMVSTAICFEIVFPHLARQAVLSGAELLTTLTNDAWYGDSSAPYQHFALASMRAIEQGRYLARAANTGISGIVDPYGRAVARTRTFQEAVVVGEIRFLQGRTLYATIGDVVAWVSLATTVLVAVWLVVPTRRQQVAG